MPTLAFKAPDSQRGRLGRRPGHHPRWQPLNPITGEVQVGGFTVGVIDVETDVETEVEVWRQNFGDYANAAEFLADWIEVSNPGGRATWDLNPTHTVSSPTAAHVRIVGTVSPSEEYRLEKVIGGFAPNQPLTFKRQLWASGGTTPTGVFFEASTGLTADGSGNATVFLRILVVEAGTVDWDIWFDDVRLLATTGTFSRIVTSKLADTEGQNQLLSRRAYLEETEDAGASWPVLVAGYVNSIRLGTALRYEFTIGESRRVEQTSKVFEVIEAGFDRASCIIGGPIIGDFGPYPDLGRPRFAVSEVSGDTVTLRWVDGNFSSPMREFGRPLRDNVFRYLWRLANHYNSAPGVFGAPFPDLIVRLFSVGTGPGITTGLADHDFTPLALGVNHRLDEDEFTGLNPTGLFNDDYEIKVASFLRSRTRATPGRALSSAATFRRSRSSWMAKTGVSVITSRDRPSTSGVPRGRVVDPEIDLWRRWRSLRRPPRARRPRTFTTSRFPVGSCSRRAVISR